MTKNVIHVVGTGTIGEPLITLFLRIRPLLGIDYDVTFSKYSPRACDRPKVNNLISEGAILAVEQAKLAEFRNMGMNPSLDFAEAMECATVIIDCSSKSGNIHKEQFYKKLEDKVLGFIAQGSEKGFGKPYAFNITGSGLCKDEKYIWVVSCNTHNVAVIVWTIALNLGALPPDNLVLGDFTLMRRATDISQPSKGFVPSLEVGRHNDGIFGTHQAEDAARLFHESLGMEVKLFSSATIIPSQYMHVMRFALELKEQIDITAVLERIGKNPLIAVTEKDNTANVFSFGREHGPRGRILNQTVIPIQTLGVYGNRVIGFCFTPQDGNSLLSSVAATLRFLYPDNYLEMMQKILVPPFVHKEV